MKVSFKRLGPIQLVIVSLVNRGIRDFDEIVRILSSLSIPKSSIYTAVDELEKKKIIVITVDQQGRRIIDLQSRTDLEKILDAKKKLIDRLKVLTILLSMIYEEQGDYSLLDPAILEQYKIFLEKELEKTKQALSKWKKVSIE